MQKPQLQPERIACLLICTNIFLLLNSDIHLPALPYLQKDLETSEFKSQLVLIIFMFGAIFSRLIWGPLSDKYGRRKIMLVTIGLQAATQLGMASAPTIDWLLFWRALQSLGAGIITVIGTAIIVDLFRGDNRARFLGFHEMAFPISFMVAPIIGAYLFDLTHTWRAAFIFMFIIQGGAFAVFYFFLPETHIATNEDKLIQTFKVYTKVLANRHFMLYNLISGMMIGLTMMFAVISPFIYITRLGVSVRDYAFFQFAPMLISIASALIYRYVANIFGLEYLLRLSIRLLALLIPLYLMIGHEVIKATPYTILLAVCIQSAIAPFFMPGVITKSMDIYPHIKGLASSAAASIRSLCATVAMFVGSYYVGSNIAALFNVKCLLISIILFLFWVVNDKSEKNHRQ